MKKTITIPIEIEIPKGIRAITVDKNGLICGHVSVDNVSSVVRNKDGLSNEWILNSGVVLGKVQLYDGGSIRNWKDSLVKYEG